MKHLLYKTAFLVFIAFLPSLCLSQFDREAFVEEIESYLKKKHIPGAIISIVKSDTIIFVDGIGYANIEKGEKVSDQHLFRQGSISKSFTALGLFKLIHESPYSLNSPIRDIDPNIPFTNQWQNTEPVQVSHILEHTSGFEDFHLHAIYNTKDSTLPPIINIVKDHAKSLHSRWRPGTKKAYSNPNYIVAGHLVEVLSNRHFDEYMKENILEPIGMKSSGFYFKQPKDKRFAQGYQRTGNTLNPISFATINGNPAGDFSANAYDMAAYLQFALNKDTTLFPAIEFDRIETPQTSSAAKNGLRFGYGLGNYTIWKNKHLFHGHGGQIDGFSARYVYSREADLGVAIAINRNGDANDMVKEVLNYLVGIQDSSPEDRITYPIPASLKKDFSGFYEFKSPKSKLIAFSDRMLAGLTLDFKDDKLITRTILGKAKDTLYYAGNNQFYLNDEGAPSVLLIKSANQKPALWINDNYTEKESRVRRLFIFFGLLTSFLLLASFFLYSLIWLIKNTLTSVKKSPINHLALFGVGVCLILMFTGFGLTVANTQSAMNMSFSSLLMYLSSYGLVLFSLISVYRWVKLPKKLIFNVLYVLTSMGAVMISIYLWDIGLIGLKLWSY